MPSYPALRRQADPSGCCGPIAARSAARRRPGGRIGYGIGPREDQTGAAAAAAAERGLPVEARRLHLTDQPLVRFRVVHKTPAIRTLEAFDLLDVACHGSLPVSLLRAIVRISGSASLYFTL